MESAIDYIQAKDWQYKTQTHEYIIQVCPYCHDKKYHFYINHEGLFYCHKCMAKGNLYKLKKHMGDIQPRMKTKTDKIQIKPAFEPKIYKMPDPGLADKYHEALLSSQQAMEYIRGRGITEDTTRHFKLGLMSDKQGQWISIPHYAKGRLINIKYRYLGTPPKDTQKYKRLEGCQSILFNVDILKTLMDRGQKEIIITEGEIDCITLLQQGINNAIAITVGAKTFHPEWIDDLQRFEKIYLCFDPDPEGKEGAYKTAKKLSLDRCFNIEMPGQDVNNFFNSEGALDKWYGLVDEAKRFDLPGVIPIQTAIDLLCKEISGHEDSQGLLTPWNNVNQLIKGFYPGDLIILSAYPKIGKTTFALNIARHLVFKNIPVLIFCLEMRPERLIKKFIQSEYRKETLSEDEIKQFKDFSGLPLYFSHSFRKEKLEDIIDLIRDAVRRYDLRLVIFDNLHFLIRSTSNVNEELGQAVQGFKLLAEEMKIPIIAIAQPRKKDSMGSDRIMCAEDVKYSNAIHADCDMMIILHRNRIASKAKEINEAYFMAKDEALDPVTLVRIEAHRYGPGGEALLNFHGEYSRFDLVERRGNG